jgi:hypothetical protein
MTDKDAKQRLEQQYKRQNEHIKKSYDRVSATLPVGTVERIKSHGLSVNGLINSLVLKELDRLESEQMQEEPKEEKREERKREPLSLEELQKLVNDRKAEYNPSEYVEPMKKEKTALHYEELEQLLQGIKDRRNKENEAQQ